MVSRARGQVVPGGHFRRRSHGLTPSDHYSADAHVSNPVECANAMHYTPHALARRGRRTRAGLYVIYEVDRRLVYRAR